ncbi:hypothetical protein HPB48_019045 [Haemaphysalis longicornis]|uniref:DDE Tnp4 domain-containing protein n=1 Tax=Haemaphysalis longicornis TaxID=44386 RepID=A0A9J6GE30_HAELO|nr:hypothetical protein HPB48_019045 [Haemaphysalis longicornis]
MLGLQQGSQQEAAATMSLQAPAPVPQCSLEAPQISSQAITPDFGNQSSREPSTTDRSKDSLPGLGHETMMDYDQQDVHITSNGQSDESSLALNSGLGVDDSAIGDVSSSWLALGATTCVSCELCSDCPGAGQCFGVVVHIMRDGGVAVDGVGRQCMEDRRMSAEKTFLIGLTYLAMQITMNHIADKFDVAESSVQNNLNRLLDFLFSISEEIIRCPAETERERSFQAFRTMAKTKSGKQGLPNVIGCIDGCHIEIPKPAVSEHSYYNCKKYHSILLQGICNERKEFIDVFAGYPGSTHDARVLKKSFFYEDAAAKCEGGYLLGDSAYPLLPWLIPPYKSTRGLAQHEEDFNRLHRQQRVTIEGAFGLLKNRFRRLFYVNALSIKQAVLMIIGSCVLHNYCIRTSDDNTELPRAALDVPLPDDDSDLQPCAGDLRDETALSL